MEKNNFKTKIINLLILKRMENLLKFILFFVELLLKLNNDQSHH